MHCSNHANKRSTERPPKTSLHVVKEHKKTQSFANIREVMELASDKSSWNLEATWCNFIISSSSSSSMRMEDGRSRLGFVSSMIGLMEKKKPRLGFINTVTSELYTSRATPLHSLACGRTRDASDIRFRFRNPDGQISSHSNFPVRCRQLRLRIRQKAANYRISKLDILMI